MLLLPQRSGIEIGDIPESSSRMVEALDFRKFLAESNLSIDDSNLLKNGI